MLKVLCHSLSVQISCDMQYASALFHISPCTKKYLWSFMAGVTLLSKRNRDKGLNNNMVHILLNAIIFHQIIAEKYKGINSKKFC